MTISKNGNPILTLDEWERLAGPKSPDQWRDDRSAKEVARAWLEAAVLGGMPEEITKTLLSHSSFSAIQKWKAEPEAKLCFDTFRGEPRNSDLAIYAEDSFGPFLLAVEAKADEPFGETVGDALAAAMERKLLNERSNGVIRIEQLATALLGPRLDHEPLLQHIRYQLLTASAGALCEAERHGMTRAGLLVHEFVTAKTLDEKHEANSTDLNRFVERLSHGAVTSIEPGRLYGPFAVPGMPLLSSKAHLFVGKAVRRMR